MADSIVMISCPKCRYSVEAPFRSIFKLIMFLCPKCKSNVVYYDKKTDIISDAMVSKLRSDKKLAFYAMDDKKPPTKAPIKRFRKPQRRECLSEEDLLNLKILLETETDTGSFLSKI